ncbi:putative YkwD family protein [Caldalkalibacillus uzonensis]|uniref:YkwD family protein n=1 Tax=Caldalkalibacillus uzonensis TaxID=353224 RepID=A0ABU0CQG6_9BACI|nr:CAP domain-containing protein [Caldalkalibacillus uzonensis]MDQ0337247.1 putative YkwD family protein [Caldalkalibacillus uzonensis]
MFRKVALLFSISLLVFGSLGVINAQAATSGCDVWSDKLVRGVDTSQFNQEVAQLIENVLGQFNLQQPQQAEPSQQTPPAQGSQDGVQQSEPEQQYQAPQNDNERQIQTDTEVSLSADEQKMVDLVNQERQKRGLSPLKVDAELVKVARVKAQDMIDNNYFGHHSPTYGSPFDMLNHFGVQFRTAGENLAGNPSVEGAHQSLMNSDGHRANILNGQFGKVGIGIIDGGPYGKMFVQLFTD